MHCLKYGLTTNNVLGIEFVTPDGEVVRLGGRHLDSGHYDLLGLAIGSEGLIGIVTEVTVRILRKPQTARALLIGFPEVEPAGAAVADIIAAGIIPGGMELMDRPAIAAAEAFVNVGYPLDVEALLIVELDGPAVEVDELIERVTQIANGHGATSCRASTSDEERLAFWAGRKAAFPAVGRLSPDYLCMDGTIPRRELPRVLRAMSEMSKDCGLRVANVFHAGDGNIHPILLFDERDAAQTKRVIEAGEEILAKCIELGGSVTGEHGIGVEKVNFMDKLFTADDVAVMTSIREVFNPDGRCSPQKILPTAGACGMEHIEKSHPGRQAAM